MHRACHKFSVEKRLWQIIIGFDVPALAQLLLELLLSLVALMVWKQPPQVSQMPCQETHYSSEDRGSWGLGYEGHDSTLLPRSS